MKNTLSENFSLLNQDAQKILDVRFSMLFSLNRNRFFSFLQNYIAFYNEYRTKVLQDNPSIASERIPKLIFKQYFLSMPIAFWFFIRQWNCILKIKKNLVIGLKTINSVAEKNE